MSVRPETKLHRAILFISFAAVCAAVMGACVKIAAPYVTTQMIVFSRMLLSLMLISIWMQFSSSTPWKEKTRTRDWKIQWIRALSGIVSFFLYFYALKYLPLADALMLFNTMPLFVPFVAYIWKKHPIPGKIFWGIGTAFFGIILILKPSTGVFQVATLWALLSGIIGAISTMAVRFSHYTEPAERTLFYYFLLGSLMSGLVTLSDIPGNWQMLNLQSLNFFLVIGGIGFIYQVLFTVATKYAPVRMTSPFLYLGVVVSAFLDWGLWGRVLSLWTCVGFVFVFVGAFLTVYLFPKHIR